MIYQFVIKKIKSCTFFMCVFFLQAACVNCSNTSKPLSGALLFGAKLVGYQRNHFVRLCKEKDFPYVHEILGQHKLRMRRPLPTQSEMLTLVYEKNNAIQGVCITSFHGYVYRLAADKKFQGQGVGRALLQETIFRLQPEYGAQSLVLKSTASAISFYEKMGFDFQGHRYDYAAGCLSLAKKE